MTGQSLTPIVARRLGLQRRMEALRADAAGHQDAAAGGVD
jgi:hypothetical protein